MVLKSIERIKIALPEVAHVVMFYNDGTVFQSTLGPSVNIPKTGENLSGILNNMKKLLEILKIETEPYKKFVYETKTHTIIVLKLGENSNLALFFENIKGENINFRPIRKYLSQIERLIDMDRIDLEKQELKQKETEFHINELNVQLKLSQLEKLETDVTNFENEIYAKKRELESKKAQLASDKEIADVKRKELKGEIDQMEVNLRKAEDRKDKMLNELKNMKVMFDKEQQAVTEKSKIIEEMKEKIEKEEKEKLAEKMSF